MFHRWNALPDLPELASLSGTELADEKTRLEAAKLRLEVQEERSWRSKLIVTTLLSVLVPLGGAVVFLNTWFGARMGDRKSAQDALYAESAKNLSNEDASVRLNAVTTLDSFLHPAPQSWFRREVNSLIGRGDENAGDEAAGCDAPTGAIEPASIRGCEIVALLIGRLSDETDPAVLDAISDVAIEHATAGIKPLLSLNRSEAIQFARAAGDFSATYILRMRRLTSMAEDADDYTTATMGSVRVIGAVTERTGSPFEAKNLMNQRWVSEDFLERTVCPFREAFLYQQRMGLSSGFSTPLLVKPPDVTTLRKTLNQMIASATMLEKTSYVVGRLAGDAKGMSALKKQDLYGVAIVVGQLKDSTVSGLRVRGAYIWEPGDQPKDVCRALPVP